MRTFGSKHYSILFGLALVVLTLSGGYASSESEPGEWEFSRIGEWGRYITNGALVHGHYFGFVYNDQACDEQYLWLTWSTYEDGLEEFEGDPVSVRLELGEDVAEIDLTLLSVHRMTPLLSLVTLTNGRVSGGFIEQVAAGTDLKVTVIGPEPILNRLDVRGDLFDVRGLKAAHARAVAQCGRDPVAYI